MNTYVTAATIRTLREMKNLTQGTELQRVVYLNVQEALSCPTRDEFCMVVRVSGLVVGEERWWQRDFGGSLLT